MANQKKTVRELEKLSQNFLDAEKRKVLLGSVKKDKTEWYLWVSQLKGVLKNLDKIEATKFTGLVLMLEQSPDSEFQQNNLKKFLIDKTEFYKHYDFSLEKDLAEEKRKRGNIWISKVFRLFISRSFLGMLILVLIIAFILWFYLDRESCLEFVSKVVEPFLKSIR